ncbi:MAG: helix-turn-helix transcriptional regulator [Acidiferrobacterales bacterium]|nr:helix-turn-helix transcriptional regulator [Acidiferrobacterales bacterium]
MARRRPDDLIKQRMWAALLKAAQRHHDHPAEYGMITLIARDAGVTKASVSEWKRGSSYPEDATLRRLADLYRVPVTAIAGYDEPLNDLGPPDKLMRSAADITEQVLSRLLPDAGLEEFMQVTTRANELILDGKSDQEVKGELFDLVPEIQKRRAE